MRLQKAVILDTYYLIIGENGEKVKREVVKLSKKLWIHQHLRIIL